MISIPSDTNDTCFIGGICSLPSGQVIVIDQNNKRVKLLDQHYTLSSHCNLSGDPWDICKITSNEVAVTVYKYVQFISVTNGQLVNVRKFQLPHEAVGIAYHQGALYVTSYNALYHFTLKGSLVKKLYEDGIKSISNTVFKCAVSPDGDRIYVTNCKMHKLITLASDGTVISTFTDDELQKPWGIHVTPAGQVLVCGCNSNTVIQVDRQGKKKLATLESNKDGVRQPVSVCYNNKTDQIIVGLHNNNKINVMELP
ncbi:uncharacterized protein LOC127837293 [Dreissena polymorpha]|uniref:uncharacterized protein LOC127837293 n=1 Tax=Dreissena polymorpha TaxID=45954 RepID=UPI00226544D3|nr:uncharacterized protein LOC127837293 [Dreissena polymorpha]